MRFIKRKSFSFRAILFGLMLCLLTQVIYAQQSDCILQPPAVTVDFGSGSIEDINARLPKYRQDFTTCPPDGFYSYSSHTSGCFNGDWLSFNGDHTGIVDGNMMLVNASVTGGVFFNTVISGLKPNSAYRFAAWMVNVCKTNGGCRPLPPNITIRLLTTSGKMVAQFITGKLAQNDAPRWKKYFGFFVTPPDGSSLVLNMEDITLGGCGNDFALDDITFSECAKPAPVVQTPPVVLEKPAAKQPPVVKQVAMQTPLKTATIKKDIPALIKNKPQANIPAMTLPSIKVKTVETIIPQPLLTRENPIVKQIETGAGEMKIDLYDNSEIDGDTVSIYHNNVLLISRAGLSDKPVHFVIKVGTAAPHHELVMVANNLGSIPPNTSLMIITVNNKRYEVHISSSEQKNAKVVINLAE